MSASPSNSHVSARLVVKPRAAASMAVFDRIGRVLLIERGKGPPGLWSLPGGHIECGETAAAAAVREVREETGVVATLHGLADVQDIFIRDASGTLLSQYVIAVFAGSTEVDTAMAASDARSAAFVVLDDIKRYATTHGLEAIVHKAFSLVGEAARSSTVWP